MQTCLPPGFEGIEIEGAERIEITTLTATKFRRIQEGAGGENSFAGFFLDCYTATGYTKRVAITAGLGEPDRSGWEPPWGKVGNRVDQMIQVEAKESYSIRLADYAPADWNGRVIFAVAVQNTGPNTLLKVQVAISPEPESLEASATKTESSLSLDDFLASIPPSAATQKDSAGRLTDLDCSRVELTNAQLDLIGSVETVRVLYLPHTGLYDSGLERLRRLSALRILGIWNTEITDEGIKFIAGFTELTELTVEGCGQVGDEGARVISRMPKLAKLGMSWTGGTRECDTWRNFRRWNTSAFGTRRSPTKASCVFRRLCPTASSNEPSD